MRDRIPAQVHFRQHVERSQPLCDGRRIEVDSTHTGHTSTFQREVSELTQWAVAHHSVHWASQSMTMSWTVQGAMVVSGSNAGCGVNCSDRQGVHRMFIGQTVNES